MRTGFVTCVQLGLACLEGIEAAGGRVDSVFTLRDELGSKKSGRVYLDDFCTGHGIELIKIRNINDAEAVGALRDRAFDWLFIIGWSQIAREAVLATPRRGCIGAHPTLLPQGRGRAAIPWTILKGLPETGVTFFQLDHGVDTGPILAQEKIAVGRAETAATLYRKIADAHREGMRKLWPLLASDRVQPRPQDEQGATVWPGRRPEDGEIRPDMTVEEIDLLVRAVTRPYPGAFLRERDRTVRIWSGRTGSSGMPAPPGAYRIAGVDGVYDALEYEIEPAESDWASHGAGLARRVL